MYDELLDGAGWADINIRRLGVVQPIDANPSIIMDGFGIFVHDMIAVIFQEHTENGTPVMDVGRGSGPDIAYKMLDIGINDGLRSVIVTAETKDVKIAIENVPVIADGQFGTAAADTEL